MPGSQPPLVAAEIERTAMGLAGRFAGPSLENNSGGAAVLVDGNVVHQLSANGEPTIVSSSLKPVGYGDLLDGEGGMVEGGGAPLIGICSQVAAAEGSLGQARRVFDKMPQWQTAKKKGKSPLPYSSYFLGRHPLVGLAIWGAPARRGRPPAGQAWVGGPLRAPQGHITQAPMYTAEEGGHSSLRRGRFHAQGSIVERGPADRIPVRDLQIQRDKTSCVTVFVHMDS